MPRFDADRYTELARARQLGLGRPVTWTAVTGSTSDDALAAARAGAAHGAVFVADEQTHGRGRRGQTWVSPPGQDLLFSVVLRPEIAAPKAPALTLAVGLAVREVVGSHIRAEATVKWPNDVWVGGRKIAGILVEAQLQGERLAAVVVGVGLNVAVTELPPGLVGTATSLALEGAGEVEREVLLVELLEAMGRRLETFCESGLGPMLDELRSYDAVAGRRVCVGREGGVGRVDGIARGIDEAGALLIEETTGQVRAVASGSVELV